METIPFEVDIILLVDNFVFVLLAWYYKRYPPKTINSLYGFRTRRSMANQDIWTTANRVNAKYFFNISVILLLLQLGCWIFEVPYRFIIHVVALLIGVAIGIYLTIRYLDRHFDNSGNRKG